MLAPASLHGPFIISSGSHSKQNKALLFFCLETSLNHPDQQCPSCSCARGSLGDPLGPWASGRRAVWSEAPRAVSRQRLQGAGVLGEHHPVGTG